jgi:hypothetical protein
MLTIGQNTYIDITAADAYISVYYTKYAPLRVIWSVLTDEEKAGYLLNAVREIEALPIAGDKHLFTQPLKFPRRDIAVTGGVLPEAVKQAQAENALGIINAECILHAKRQIETLKSMGAVKNALSLDSPEGTTNITVVGSGQAPRSIRPGGGVVAVQKPKLTSAKANEIMRGWIGSI